jgi:hypothetical protein
MYLRHNVDDFANQSETYHSFLDSILESENPEEITEYLTVYSAFVAEQYAFGAPEDHDPAIMEGYVGWFDANFPALSSYV